MSRILFRPAAAFTLMPGLIASHAALAEELPPMPVSEPNALQLFGIGVMGAVLIARLIKRK